MKKLTIALVAAVAVLAVASHAMAESDANSQLKQTLVSQIDGNADASPEVKAFVKETLLPLCTNPVFVAAIQAQNAKGMTLDDIKKIDQAWADAEEELPIQKELLNNPCAAEIRSIASSKPAIAETFVMDNQGANVGQNELTSDYWQGDEPKWQNSYKEGQGGVDIAKNKLDKSSSRTMQQISLPVCDENGKVIGAVTFGLAVDSI